MAVRRLISRHFSAEALDRLTAAASQTAEALVAPELDVVESESNCCGVAGTYGLKREKYDIAMQVGAGLFKQIADTAPDRAVCDSETCRWQIEHATRVSTVHPVEVLHRASGLA